MTAENPEDYIKENLDMVKVGNRGIFQNIKSSSYLNFAAFTPPSMFTRKIMDNWFEDYSSHGASAYINWANQRERLRQKLAELINCKPENIGFGDSTSGLISDVTLMLDWKAGDRVLVFNGDFPSVIYPVKNAAKMFDLEVVMHDLDGFGDNSGLGLERIEEELQTGLRLIALSSTQYHTGLLMPVQEISRLCKKYGAELLVDAAQSCGAINVDVTDDDVDFLMAPTHKWLMGIEGAGFIFMSERALDRLVCRRSGWMSYEKGLEFLFGDPDKVSYENEIRRRPSFLELGMSNSVGFAALEAGISTHLHIGMTAISEHVQSLHDILEDGLQSLGYTTARHKNKNARSSILSMKPPKSLSTKQAAAKFAEHKIAISTPDGYLRFAPSWPTSVEEVEYALDAAKSF
mgnify:CR=1 FL=1